MRLTRRRALRGAGAAAVCLAAASSFAAPQAGAGAPLRPRRGVNVWPWFALTREYPAPRRDYAWPPYQSGRPVPSPQDLRRLHAVGFDFIRLPVDPGPLLAADAAHRAILIDDVMRAVAAARDAGLAVVLNVQPNEATHYWRSQTMIAAITAPEFARYRALVAAFAEALGRRDDAHVALEPANEPPQSCGAASWSQVQIALLRAARAAAPHLTLVATGSCGSMTTGLAALDPDPLCSLEPLLYTFHFYEPYLFSHQGAPWLHQPVYRDLNQVPWPAARGSLARVLAAVRTRMRDDPGWSQQAKDEAYATTEKLMKDYFDGSPDRRYLEPFLATVTAWGKRHMIAPDRIVMGEFGALKTTGRYVAARDPDRVRYIRDVREAAEDHGFGWAFWDLFDGMGLADDLSHAFDPAVLEALGLRPT